MTRLRIFLFRLRALFRSRQMDREIDDEITSHLAEATEEYVQKGLSPEEARRAARRSFGGVTADQGGVSGGAVIHVAGGIVARLAVCASHAPQESGLYDGRGRHTGAGDCHQHRHVQRPRCGSAPPPAVPVAGTAGDVVDRGSDAEPSRGPIGTVGCRTVAASESKLRGHGHLRYRGHPADRS